MSGNERFNSDELLEQAIVALSNQVPPDGPPEHLQAATIQALQDLSNQPRPRAETVRRSLTMLRVTRVGGAAAALAIGLLVAVFFLSGLGSSFTFADVLDKLERAGSVHFVAKLAIEGQATQESKLWIQGDIVRTEPTNEVALVVDTRRRQGLQLDLVRKKAEQLDFEGQISADEFKDPIDELRSLKDQEGVKVTQLGDEMVGERLCHVYRVEGAKALRMQGDWQLWVDPATALPVQMQIGGPKSSMTFEQMVWDTQLDPSLFSLTPPAGFELMRPIAAKQESGRIVYHIGSDVFSVRPDGTDQERQFAPASEGAGLYVTDKAELSPDGRYLAIAFPSVREGAVVPPERILMWDRTRPEASPREVYAAPGAELSHWRFSADGKRLYVAWWKKLADKNWPHGMGAEFIDIASGARTELKLPTYTTANGEELPSEFADVAPDGQTYLVAGQHLQLLTAEGQLLRTLTAGESFVDARSVRYSPDGQHVLYATSQRSLGYRLCQTAIAGGEPTVLVAEGRYAGFRARWSPDGRQVALSCRKYAPNHPRRFGSEAYLMVIQADGQGLETLLKENVDPNAKSFELTGWR